jgi:hypothetical protein
MTLQAGPGAVDASGPGPLPRYALPMLVAGAKASVGGGAAELLGRLRGQAASLPGPLSGRKG